VPFDFLRNEYVKRRIECSRHAGIGMSGDSDRLRERAAQLFALAILARANAAPYADAITELASEALAQAEEMERRRAQPDTSDK
jgi:hypothetical protein